MKDYLPAAHLSKILNVKYLDEIYHMAKQFDIDRVKVPDLEHVTKNKMVTKYHVPTLQKILNYQAQGYSNYEIKRKLTRPEFMTQTDRYLIATRALEEIKNTPISTGNLHMVQIATRALEEIKK